MNIIIIHKLKELKIRRSSIVFFITSFFILLFNLLVFEVNAAEGKTGVSFLKLGIGARPLAMGGIGSSLPGNNLTSFYWNPAGLQQIQGKELLLTHNERSLGIRHEYLAYGKTLGEKSAMGIGLNYLTVDDIEKRSGKGIEPEGEVKASDLELSVGYSRKLTQNLSLGMSTKLVQEELAEYKKKVLALDLGALSTQNNFNFGVTLKNIGPGIKFIEQRNPLPLFLSGGVSYLSCDKRSILAMELNKPLYENRFKLIVGGENWLTKNFAIRSGYSREFNSHAPHKNKYSLGAGFKTGKFELDYAYLPFEDIGNTHQISLLIHLGEEHIIILPHIEIEMEDVYPSKYKQYAQRSLGIINITNRSKHSLYEVRIRLFIPEYMSLPTEHRIDEIKPYSTLKIPLKAVFSERLFLVDEDTPIQVKVEIEYLHEKKMKGEVIIGTTTLFNRNTMDWKELESIGSFITYRDTPIRQFIGEVTCGREEMASNLLQAIELFSALSSYNIQYLPDPTTLPNVQRILDTVQFPRETLNRKKGDCDDLVVLYSACLENIGIPTAIVSVPGHLFLMFNTGLLVKKATNISFVEDWLIPRDNYLWLPIEITQIGESFVSAWQRGVEQYKRWKTLEIADTKEAWISFPPVFLPPTTWLPVLPSKEVIDNRVTDEIVQFKKYREESGEIVIRQIKQSLESHPKELNLYNKLGMVYGKLGRYDEAKAEFKSVLELDEKNSGAYNNLGNIYALEGDIEKAKEYYQQALSLDEADGGIYFNLGIIYLSEDDESSAIEMMVQSLHRFDDFEKATLILGLELLEIPWLKGDPNKISKKELDKLLNKVLSEMLEKSEKIKLEETKSKVITILMGIRREDMRKGLQSLEEILYWK